MALACGRGCYWYFMKEVCIEPHSLEPLLTPRAAKLLKFERRIVEQQWLLLWEDAGSWKTGWIWKWSAEVFSF